MEASTVISVLALSIASAAMCFVTWVLSRRIKLTNEYFNLEKRLLYDDGSMYSLFHRKRWVSFDNYTDLHYYKYRMSRFVDIGVRDKSGERYKLFSSRQRIYLGLSKPEPGEGCKALEKRAPWKIAITFQVASPFEMRDVFILRRSLNYRSMTS